MKKKIEEIEELFKLIEKVETFEEKQLFNVFYSKNDIEELKANEDAHSLVFRKLLFYKTNNTFPFLASFIKKIGITENIDQKVTVFKDSVDTLITNNKCAIIIGNEINYEKDQKKRIEHNYEVIKKMYGVDKAYVIYLTRWENKKTSKDSLPNELKEKLQDRIYECNFKDHISPWLEEAVLPYCKTEETVLTSAVKKYIDLLKGMASLRKNETKVRRDMRAHIKKKTGVDILGPVALEKSQKLIRQKDELLNKLNKYEKKILIELVGEAKYSDNSVAVFPFKSNIQRPYISEVDFTKTIAGLIAKKLIKLGERKGYSRYEKIETEYPVYLIQQKAFEIAQKIDL